MEQQIPCFQEGPLGGIGEQFLQSSLCSEHDNIAVAQEISFQWELMAKRMKVLPEATFSPTVAGLCTRENQDPEPMDQMKFLISTLSQAINTGQLQ
ncbi:hypothetical protein E2320_009632, partial [Naja naja]